MTLNLTLALALAPTLPPTLPLPLTLTLTLTLTTTPTPTPTPSRYSLPQRENEWIHHMLEYNTKGGKMTRGLMVVETASIIFKAR